MDGIRLGIRKSSAYSNTGYPFGRIHYKAGVQLRSKLKREANLTCLALCSLPVPNTDRPIGRYESVVKDLQSRHVSLGTNARARRHHGADMRQ